jgi:hypothetical protein
LKQSVIPDFLNSYINLLYFNVFFVDNDKSTKKKVDKLGRARPTVYSHSSEPVRKRKVPSTAETSNSASINNKSRIKKIWNENLLIIF